MVDTRKHIPPPTGVTTTGRFCTAEDYRYGFQGQEEDSELWQGAVSFKYRIEDARLGRFFSVDPLCSKFTWNSSYAFSENSLISFIELEGLEKISFNALQGKSTEHASKVQLLKGEFESSDTFEVLNKAVESNNCTDVYILLIQFGCIFDDRGFHQSGKSGSTRFVNSSNIRKALQKGFDDPYGVYQDDVESSIEAGREVIIVGIEYAYIEQMVKSLPSDAASWNVSKFVNTLEDALHTLDHEVRAHILNRLNGITMDEAQEHKKYDGELSSSSPPYRSIPLHGRTPSSRKKLALREEYQDMREKFQVLCDEASKAQKNEMKDCK